MTIGQPRIRCASVPVHDVLASAGAAGMSGEKQRVAPMAVAGVLLGAFLAAAPIQIAKAHPHGWIEITVEVLFDEIGRVTGLRENWLFDEAYTAFAVEELGGSPSQQDIDALLGGIIRNLEEYAYFTKVKYNGEEVAFAPVTEASSALRGQRLDMTFLLRFEAPLDLKGSRLLYAIFDPTYYIEILHSESEDAVRLEAAPAGCTHHMIEPNPAMEAVALAAALDRTQTAGDGLGSLFAEWVEIECP